MAIEMGRNPKPVRYGFIKADSHTITHHIIAYQKHALNAA